jgi:hypothetical protein
MGNSASGYAGIMEVWGLQALHFFKINVKYLGIPSPKGDIDGSQVDMFFYEIKT